MLVKSLTLVTAVLFFVSCTKDDDQVPEPEKPIFKIAEFEQIQGSTKLYYNGDTLVKTEQLINNSYTDQLEYTYIVNYKYEGTKLTGYTRHYLPVTSTTPTFVEEVKLEYHSNGFLKQSVIKDTRDTIFWTTTAKGEITGYEHNNSISDRGAWDFNNDGNAIPLSYTNNIGGQVSEVKREITYNNQSNPFYPVGRILLITYRYMAGNFYLMLSKNQVTQFKMESKLTGPAPSTTVQLSRSENNYTYQIDEKGVLNSYQEKYKLERFVNGEQQGNTSAGEPIYKIKWHPN
jgi:hypothetical protein